MKHFISSEPVRLYGIAVSAVALAAYFLPSDAWPLVLALVATVLGVGETVRHQVTPTADPHDQAGRTLVPHLPGVPWDDEPTTGAPDSSGGG